MTVGTAAQGQGRQEGIVDIADTAEGGRGVPDDAHRRDPVAVGVCHLLFLAMDGGTVSQAVETDHLIRKFESFRLIL